MTDREQEAWQQASAALREQFSVDEVSNLVGCKVHILKTDADLPTPATFVGLTYDGRDVLAVVREQEFSVFLVMARYSRLMPRKDDETKIVGHHAVFLGPDGKVVDDWGDGGDR